MKHKKAEVINFVLKGKNRTKIILFLTTKIGIPKDISKQINSSLTSTCRSIKDLVDQDLIQPVFENPNGNNLYKLNDYLISKETIDTIKQVANNRINN